MRCSHIFTALEDGKHVRYLDLPIPHHGKVFFLFDIGIDDAAVPSMSHDDFTRGQQSWWLRACGPPNDIALDGVELFECSLNACWRAQHLVDIAQCHAVGHQGPFQDHARVFFNSALARKFRNIKKIFQGFGAIGAHLGFVIGDDVGIGDVANGAGQYQARTEVFGGRRAIVAGRQSAGIDFLKQALFTAFERLCGLQVDHVPLDVASFDLGCNLGQGAAVIYRYHLDAALGLKGFVH